MPLEPFTFQLSAPPVRLEPLSALTARLRGAEFFLKLEMLQPIGSSKIRDACNVIRQLSASNVRDGVWTVSAGNAAQRVALSAGRLRGHHRAFRTRAR